MHVRTALTWIPERRRKRSAQKHGGERQMKDMRSAGIGCERATRLDHEQSDLEEPH